VALHLLALYTSHACDTVRWLRRLFCPVISHFSVLEVFIVYRISDLSLALWLDRDNGVDDLNELASETFGD